MAKKKITMIDLAGKFGVSRDTITRWINAGHIPYHIVNGKRVLYEKEAIKAAKAYADSRSLADQARRGIASDRENNSVPSEIHLVKTSFEKSKAVKENFNAKMARLLYEKKLGELIKVEVVEAKVLELALIVRGGMLNIPGKVSAELASMTSEKEIHNFLDKTIRTALSDISDKKLEAWNESKLGKNK